MEQLDERCVLKIALIMMRIKRDQLYSYTAANGEKKRRFSDRSSANGFLFFLSVSLVLFLLRWLALRRRRVSFASTKQTLAPQIARAKSPLAAADVPAAGHRGAIIQMCSACDNLQTPKHTHARAQRLFNWFK
jgi:hypothetical protein